LSLCTIVSCFGCSETDTVPSDPTWDAARQQTIAIFDALSAQEQAGFFTTFRSSAEDAARQAFSGDALARRLRQIRTLEADLRSRQKGR